MSTSLCVCVGKPLDYTLPKPHTYTVRVTKASWAVYKIEKPALHFWNFCFAESQLKTGNKHERYKMEYCCLNLDRIHICAEDII